MISHLIASYWVHSSYSQTHRECQPIDCNPNISFCRYWPSSSLCLFEMYETWEERALTHTHTHRQREREREGGRERERSSSTSHISSKESSCLLKNICFPIVRTDQLNHPKDAQGTDDSTDHYDAKAGRSVKPVNPSISLVQKTAQMMFLWALCYPSGVQYTNPTWTAPG